MNLEGMAPVFPTAFQNAPSLAAPPPGFQGAPAGGPTAAMSAEKSPSITGPSAMTGGQSPLNMNDLQGWFSGLMQQWPEAFGQQGGGALPGGLQQALGGLGGGMNPQLMQMLQGMFGTGMA